MILLFGYVCMVKFIKFLVAPWTKNMANYTVKYECQKYVNHVCQKGF